MVIPHNRLTDRRRLSTIISEDLIELIASGALKPNDPLPSEAELAKRYNVSKPTIREALDQLEVFGIVQIQQGKQSRVNPLNSVALEGFFRFAVRSYGDGLGDAIELRRGVESEIAALAAERIDEAGIAELLAIFERMKAGLNTPDDWLSADYDFHAALARASGNTLLMQVFNGLSDTVKFTQRIVHMQRELRTPQVTLSGHATIMNAVIAHDPEGARAEMIRHFNGTKPIVVEIMKDKSRMLRF